MEKGAPVPRVRPGILAESLAFDLRRAGAFRGGGTQSLFFPSSIRSRSYEGSLTYRAGRMAASGG